MTRQRRLPRFAEREVAKLLGTLGFEDYASSLWNLATLAPRPASDSAFKEAFARHIVDQARFDPAVIASGEARLPLLRRTTRNLSNTRNVASSRLLDGLGRRASVVFVVARLDRPTQDRIAVLTSSLSDLGAASFLVIATEEPAPGPVATGAYDYVYWPDRFSGDAAASARHLALFLHISGASAIIVSGSRLGLATIGQFGLALKTVQRLFAIIEMPTTGFFSDIHHLRLVAPHATILADRREDAEALRSYAAGIEGPGVAVWTADPALAFGTDFGDPRSAAARNVCATLLGRAGTDRDASSHAVPAASAALDLTVAILFHRERELAVPALASLSAMVEAARADGITLEARAFVDRGDDATRAVVAEHGGFLDEVRVVDLGSPALARNAATAAARGRYLAFLDGDDLWGADWLARGYRAAIASPAAVWHPEALFAFWASDCDRGATNDLHSGFLIQQSSDAPGFDRRDLLFENMWSVNAIAATDLHRRFPYRADEWHRQIGIEDWRWNLETLGHGVPHAIVPDTVHLIRIKEAGSFGQLHQARALLPFLD